MDHSNQLLIPRCGNESRLAHSRTQVTLAVVTVLTSSLGESVSRGWGDHGGKSGALEQH